jgi:citrate lyase beta subunit
MGLQRSLLFVPGSEPERIESAETSVADVVVIDLEDAVAPEHKDAARENALEALAAWDGDVPLGVRINGIDTDRGIADVERIVAADAEPDFLALPDVHGASDVRIVAEQVAGTDIELLPLIEKPSAVFGVYDIVHATPRIYGLLYAAIDFQMNMGMAVLGPSDISLPRYFVSMAASVAGVPAFDKPLLVDDADELDAEIARAKELGYDGKLAVTAEQASLINDGFLPTEAEIDDARRIIAAFEESDAGFVKIEGTWVDKPVVEQLKKRLEAAEAAVEDRD